MLVNVLPDLFPDLILKFDQFFRALHHRRHGSRRGRLRSGNYMTIPLEEQRRISVAEDGLDGLYVDSALEHERRRRVPECMERNPWEAKAFDRTLKCMIRGWRG